MVRVSEAAHGVCITGPQAHRLTSTASAAESIAIPPRIQLSRALHPSLEVSGFGSSCLVVTSELAWRDYNRVLAERNRFGEKKPIFAGKGDKPHDATLVSGIERTPL